MSKILGLDLGTNSIGWAIVEKNNSGFVLEHKGVHIFPKGVGEEKNNEYSLAAERTGYRSARRMKFRRKLRKIETLKVLSEYNMCPVLSDEELQAWKNKKKYPESTEFRKWLLTDDKGDKNPYFFRNLAVTGKLDLNKQDDRYKLGRAFYHIAQRRGYKSNALNDNEDADGVVSKSIGELQEAKGEKTLGQYFYSIYGTEKIRKRYTDREKDYYDEFRRICEFQNLDNDIAVKLEKAIFFQRPLKSQKGNVVHCPFESDKKCIQISHPMYELFRMYQFMNNIKIKTPYDDELRALTEDERQKIIPCFYLSQNFKFEKIAKKLITRGSSFTYYKRRGETADFLFNYDKNTTVSNCTFIGRMIKLMEVESYDELLSTLKGRYKKAAGKSAEDVLFDIWHVLVTFDDSVKRREFARNQLLCLDEKAEEFDKIRLPQGYGNLSLKAIKKFLPFLQRGIIYSHAAFLANIKSVAGENVDIEKVHSKIIDIFGSINAENKIIEASNNLLEKMIAENSDFTGNNMVLAGEMLKSVFGKRNWEELLDAETKQQYIDKVCENALCRYRQEKQAFISRKTIKNEIEKYLQEEYNVPEKRLSLIYHPSAIETYPQAKQSSDGKYYLGSPRISSIKNPVFMRAMHRLRALLNELIKQGIIDRTTEIHVEMTRDLNDANRRMALQKWQRDREQMRKGYQAKIEEFYKEQNRTWQYSDTDLLKYQLWEEQKHICPYTGQEINITDFLGDNPLYDIEHTFPRSRGCDNSQENKTLANRDYNRKVKRNKIPAELGSDYPEIIERVNSFGWEKKIHDLEKQIERTRAATRGGNLAKEQKDRIIVKRHRLELERNYYKEKLFRFTAEEIPSSFARNQLVNTQLICKYSVLYLKTVFSKVKSYKATALKPFYEAWGVDEKHRDSHLHHCIDAILAACITDSSYKDVAEFFHQQELYEYDNKPRPKARKPWSTFADDVNNNIQHEVLVTHYSTDNLFKATKKKVRKKGIIQRNKNGDIMYAQGDTARGRLHKETFYGAIKLDDGVRYVTRKDVKDVIKGKKIDSIVDPVIREIVRRNKNEEHIWVNEVKGIEIRKVRCYDKPTSPILLKKHRDLSDNDYKQYYYVVNDSNYALAIYGDIENSDSRKHITSKSVINTLEAIKKYKEGGSSALFPDVDKNKFPLRGILKIGSKVVLYEKSPDELRALPFTEIIKRVYVVWGIESTGNLKLRYHTSVSSEIGNSHIDFDVPKEQLRLSPQYILLENIDFRIGITGELELMF